MKILELLNSSDTIKVVSHKTNELIKLIEPPCDLIVTMNVTISLLKRVASPAKTTLYFVSCSIPPAPFVKEAWPVATVHAKLYLCSNRVIISTANLSLSSFDELSLILPRTAELEQFCKRFVRELRLRNTFIAAFH